MTTFGANCETHECVCCFCLCLSSSPPESNVVPMCCQCHFVAVLRLIGSDLVFESMGQTSVTQHW